nr:Receptor protein kinase-like protein ZAR1 [Ipomoea batatas]
MKSLNFIPPFIPFIFFFFFGWALTLSFESRHYLRPSSGAGSDNTDRVTPVFLSDNNLAGYVASKIGALSSLASLILFDNNFYNPIRTRLFNATSLVYLDLSRNSFSGPLPHQITTLRTLTHLDFSSNFLNDSLLKELSSLSQLVRTLNLSHNSFSDEVPALYDWFPATLS